MFRLVGDTKLSLCVSVSEWCVCMLCDGLAPCSAVTLLRYKAGKAGWI